MGQRGRKRIEDKHPELLAMLGSQSDAALAEQFGCTPTTIGNARRRAGLPYHRSPEARLVDGMVTLSGLQGLGASSIR